MKCFNYDIVCQEIPEEITLALNISGCPNKCPGCHSPWLAGDGGVSLNENFLDLLIDKYMSGITCVCFMGGDQDPAEINRLASYIKEKYPLLKTAWYSGLADLSVDIDVVNFDYIKIGPYIEERGGLRSPDTNQKFYRVRQGKELELIRFAPKNSF